MPTEHFRDAEAYRRSRAYTHLHGIPTHAVDVVVAGKRHKVEHSRGKKSSARPARPLRRVRPARKRS